MRGFGYRTARSADDALADAKAAREDAKKLVANMTEYERRGEPYLKIRDRVAEAIEKLSK